MKKFEPRKPHTKGTAKIDFTKDVDYGIVKGKTAIIIDSATGLGLGIVTLLAENGAKVAICDPDTETGEAASKALNEQGYDTKFFTTDHTWESQLATFKGVLDWSGNQLDIVVTTAGIVTNNLMMSILPKHQSLDADPPKPPTKVIDIDLMGVYFTATLTLSYFNRLHAGKPDGNFRPQLLYICSMAGYDALEFGTDYAASKHGVRAIFKTTRKPRPSMARYQANMLAPTYVRQERIQKSEAYLKNHFNETNEIADTVQGALRCIADQEIEGRSMCCVQGTVGKPGLMNFDLCDDLADYNAGEKLFGAVDDIWLPSGAQLSEDSNCAVQ